MKTLGEEGDRMVETEVILHEHDIPHDVFKLFFVIFVRIS